MRASIRTACEACGRDPADVQILPVSKRHPVDAIREARALGMRSFGENRVQELVEKGQLLQGEDVAWQFIGSLQTNKVNQLVRVAGLELLQSLDRVKLADALQSALGDRRLDVLLQIHATDEESKHGVPPVEAANLMRHVQKECPSLRVVGVMAMGPLDGDPAPVFAKVADLHEELEQVAGAPLPVRSLGMTGDLEEAIAAGSTMVRVGTGLFGPRR